MILQNKNTSQSGRFFISNTSFSRFIRYFLYAVALSTLLFFFTNPLLIKENISTAITKAFDRFLGGIEYRAYSIQDYYEYSKGFLSGSISKNNFEIINLEITHENLSNMFHETSNGLDKNYYSGNLQIISEDGNSLKLKARGKGDRELHFENIGSMSYRLKLQGDKRYKGLKEFSLQRPIIRNYTWEYLIADIFKKESLLTLISLPVNLSINGDKRGIYTIEEVPSKITIERQKRKSGPIFGLEENVSTNIDSLLDVYEKKSWKDNSLYTYSKELLYKAFDQAQQEKEFLPSNFDFTEWAKYFALTDIFGSYHGSVPKSVKFYFNPVAGKFQPLLFDAHVGAGDFSGFIFLDFITNYGSINCEWICEYRNFYKAFLDNPEFLNLYLSYLEFYSSKNFIDSILKTHKDNFKELDNEFYSRLMPADAIFGRGFSLYMFKYDRILNRQKMISNKLSIFKDRRFDNINVSEYEANKAAGSGNALMVNSDIKLTELDSVSIIGESFNIKIPTIFMLTGENKLQGISPENPLIINGPGMFIQNGGSIDIRNVVFSNPTAIKIDNRNWSGAINTFQAKVYIHNLKIRDSIGEDAINFISSEIDITDLELEGTPSDALDSDFSNGVIRGLKCMNVGNDCLDLSESNIVLESGIFGNVLDKGISAGENSYLLIKDLEIFDSGIGLVSKDGSSLIIENVNLKSVELPIAVFNKKPSYDQPKLNILNISSNEEIFGLFNDDDNISIPDVIVREYKPSDEIESLMYGAIYGKKTVR